MRLDLDTMVQTTVTIVIWEVLQARKRWIVKRWHMRKRVNA